MFIIISNEEFEDFWGETTHIGDVLETVMIEDEQELKRYLLDKYGPTGENIRVKYRRSAI
ncbi:MAG: hypothetical protein J6J36_08130 [Clostridia bacterium]|nr:hypothetical protein [Clostridia bacterium]MBP3708541.1 hypothetical protein [Clostridia bacterium]